MWRKVWDLLQTDLKKRQPPAVRVFRISSTHWIKSSFVSCTLLTPRRKRPYDSDPGILLILCSEKIKRNSCESIWFYRLVFHFVQHSGAVQNNPITAEQKCSVITWWREENTQRTTNMATKDNTELWEGHFLTPCTDAPTFTQLWSNTQ